MRKVLVPCLMKFEINDSSLKVLESHRQRQTQPISLEHVVDYLKSAQWSFSRLLGDSIAQTNSLFLSPYPPTFFDFSKVDSAQVKSQLELVYQIKDNKLDKRKIPGAAAIMMLDPTSDKSVTYIAAPLRPLFREFHAEESTLDDHERFKQLCNKISEISKTQFSDEELAVTFGKLPEIFTARKRTWKLYDPPNRRPEEINADAADAVPSRHCHLVHDMMYRNMTQQKNTVHK